MKSKLQMNYKHFKEKITKLQWIGKGNDKSTCNCFGKSIKKLFARDCLLDCHHSNELKLQTENVFFIGMKLEWNEVETFLLMENENLLRCASRWLHESVRSTKTVHQFKSHFNSIFEFIKFNLNLKCITIYSVSYFIPIFWSFFVEHLFYTFWY